MARVNNLLKYNKGNPIGIEHPTFFPDHSLNEISFPNGKTEDLTVKVIAENMLSQVDP